MIPTLPVTMTHPESAVWPLVGLLSLALLAVITVVILGQWGGVHHLVQRSLVQRQLGGRQRPLPAGLDAALVYVPELIAPARLLGLSVALVVVLGSALWYLGGAWLALILAPVVFFLGIWLLLRSAELRYVRQLGGQLGAATARLSALLGSGQGFQPALDRVLQDLDPVSPLAQEWGWIISRLGMPLADGTLASAARVVVALREQTPAPRHRALLDHLAIALDQTHDILTRRVQAAAQAIYAADRRASAASAELAQMRYSGIAVGLAGWGMAGYLVLTQFERVRVAYAGTLGLIIGTVVLLALLSPIVGGVLLSRTTDLDY